jgi:2-oxoglutarate ferredoxin oxidoreductase subunit delta
MIMSKRVTAESIGSKAPESNVEYSSMCGEQLDTTDQPRENSGPIEIEENLCKGCGICIEFCPLKVFVKSEKLNRKGYYLPIVVKEDECVGCRLCELLCPEFAIIITNE